MHFTAQFNGFEGSVENGRRQCNGLESVYAGTMSMRSRHEATELLEQRPDHCTALTDCSNGYANNVSVFFLNICGNSNIL